MMYDCGILLRDGEKKGVRVHVERKKEQRVTLIYNYCGGSKSC